MKDRQLFLRCWGKWFLLFFVLTTLPLVQLLKESDMARVRVIKARQFNTVLAAEDAITTMFRERLDDLQILAHSTVLSRCADTGAKSACLETTNILDMTCRFSHRYDQLRVLDLEGWERVRINRDGSECREVPEEELQQKGDRYYFTEAVRLSPGQVFVSPVDLNIENGTIEKPYKPTMRFSAPVVDARGEIKAVVVLNYHASDLLDSLFLDGPKQQPQDEFISYFLVNADGYYLKADTVSERQFAFMFNRKNERFDIDYPKVWQAVLAGKNEVRVKGALFQMRAVAVPVSPLPTSFVEEGGTKTSVSQKNWYVFQRISDDVLYQTSFLSGPLRWFWYILHCVMIAFISNLWARIVLDRIARKKHYKEMQHMLRRNELLLASSGEGIYGIDTEGSITFINPAAEKMLGWTAVEVVGHHSHALFHHPVREGGEDIVCLVCAALQENKSIRVEKEQFWHRDGTSFWGSFVLSPMMEDQEMQGAVVVFQDRTQQIDREEKLRKTQMHLRRAQQIALIGVWELDLVNGSLTCSGEFFSLFEINEKERALQYDSFLEMIHPEDRDAVSQAHQESIKRKERYEITYRLKMYDGRVKWLREQGAVSSDKQGPALILIGVVFDITLQKEAEARLERERQKYKNILDLAADGLCIIDAETSRLVEWSQMVPKMLGYSEEELKYLSVLDWDKGFAHLDEFRLLARDVSYETVFFERVHTRKDGSCYDASIAAVRIQMNERDFIFVSIRDVSEQKRRIQEQANRELQLRTITDTSHDAIMMVDPQGRISFWNPAAEKILGYSAAEALGKDLHRLIVPEQLWPHFDAGFGRFLKSGTGKVLGQTLEHFAVHKDGHQIPISISTAAVTLNNEWHAVGIMRDDTERHEALLKEKQLRYQESSLLSLFDRGDALLFKWQNDSQLTTVYVSENVEHFLGVDRDEFIAGDKAFSAFLHREDVAGFTEALRSAVNDGLDYFTHLPYRIVTGRGDLRWILNHTVTQKNDKGQITHFISYLIDISRQKDIEEQTRQLKEEFETIFNTVPIPIIYINDEGRIYRRNEAFVELTGYDEETLVFLRDWTKRAFPDERYREEVVSLWQSHLTRAEKSGGIIRADLYQVTCRDGVVRPVAAGGRFISGGIIATLIDMSEEEKAKRELVDAREQAESANLAKSRFLANMSHEFRTPLNSVIGLTQMLAQRQGLDLEVKNEIEKIAISGQMLLTLVNDILDLSKIEAGEINFEMVPMQLEALFREIRGMISALAEKKGISLVFEILPAVAERYIVSDPTRLRQIVLNLLNNALKFTSDGSVTLSVESLGKPDISDGDETESLRFVVADTGCGIAPELLPTLFEAFRQADSSITRRYGGTGLGLAIVKQLTEEMGGHVAVESVVGVGSSFFVELPFHIASENQIHEAGLGSGNFTLLLVDSDPVHRQTLARRGRELGWQIELALDGHTVLNRYYDLSSEKESVDCLLIDWKMPGFDGLEFLQQIKEEVDQEKIPAILMVRSHEEDKLQRDPRAAIPDLVLTKPFSFSVLVNSLGILLRQGDEFDQVLRSSILDFTHMSWLPGVKILVVDDAQVNLDLAVALFTREGADVSTCMNGVAALRWLQAPLNSVDIVLMDIQMPEMDGNAAVREIRRDPALKDLPVIALTAAALASERALSLKAGMDDYQTKPYDIEKMVRLIRRHVAHKRGAPVPVVEKDRQDQQELFWPAIDGIDIEGVRERLIGNRDLFIVLLQGFVEANSDLLHPLSFPEKEEERNQLRARMHKLAGSAGMVGAVVFSKLTKRVEDLLRNREYDDIVELLEQVHAEYCRLERAINQAWEAEKGERDNDSIRGIEDADIQELSEALLQKKISAMQIYRKLQQSLDASLSEEARCGLEQAMTKLDFVAAHKWLNELDKESTLSLKKEE